MTVRMKQMVIAASFIIMSAAALGFPKPAIAEETANCNAGGGPGATSCSITVVGLGCSVTCSSGYACCTTPAISCLCVGGSN